MRIFLNSKAARAAITIEEFIDTALLQGASEKEVETVLLKDLEEGGRMFGEFRASIKATANGVINRLRDTAQFSEDFGVKKYRWVAVLVNTCPDCVERHGEVETMEGWEERGLPRAGFTVCKENCKCILLDADTAILEPVKRGQRSKVRILN